MSTDVLTIVLAGGVGSRLHPLTADRAKPAVPFGGKYRIIDFTLSNCLHSGLRQVLVLTQYKSHSLQKHLRDGWSIFNPGIGEYVTVVPPQMRTGNSWYEGTADAIRQNLYLLERSDAEYVLVLSGDHIYRMDYAAMVRFHRQKESQLTVACLPTPLSEASEFGVMAIDDDQQVLQFSEKPVNPRPLPDDPERALISMGIYVFAREDLICILGDENANHDFGKHILPPLVEAGSVYAYQFGGAGGRVSCDRYWRDVGSVDAYFQANMDLLQPNPPLDLYQSDWEINTAAKQCPPARSVPGRRGFDAQIFNSIIGSGCVVSGGIVRDSLLFENVRVEESASVLKAVLFDGVTVGEGARLKNCVIDKHVVVPAGETIGFDAYKDRQRFKTSPEGVVVVPKSYTFETAEVSTTARPSDTMTKLMSAG